MKLFYEYMVILFNLSPTLSHLHPLQVEDCDSNSRLVVDEDDNVKSDLEGLTLLLGLYASLTFSRPSVFHDFRSITKMITLYNYSDILYFNTNAFFTHMSNTSGININVLQKINVKRVYSVDNIQAFIYSFFLCTTFQVHTLTHSEQSPRINMLRTGTCLLCHVV